MMFDLMHRRADGTFVIVVNGQPYHVTHDDPLFAEVAAAADGVDLPPEAIPQPSAVSHEAAIDAHIESVARTRRYKSAASCAGYVNSTVPSWAAEAGAFIAWRDSVWQAAFVTLAKVEAGAPPPTIAGLIAGLPAIGWPA